MLTPVGEVPGMVNCLECGLPVDLGKRYMALHIRDEVQTRETVDVWNQRVVGVYHMPCFLVGGQQKIAETIHPAARLVD
jgi:hypothetical protein